MRHACHLQTFLLVLLTSQTATDALICHICSGMDTMSSCFNDPKSMQYLSCDDKQAYAPLQAFVRNFTRIRIDNGTAHSCIHIAYEKHRASLMTTHVLTLRSCVATASDLCTKVEEAVTAHGKRIYTFKDCHQCYNDYCNGADSYGFTVFVYLLTILKVIR